jgi:hypothetical protein
MDYDLELRFQKLKSEMAIKFGMDMDEKALLFLIGVNEYGQGQRNYTKNEKMDLMHVAICTVLMPYGYYDFVGRDEDGWPHFNLLKELPALNHREQQFLLKEAIMDYMVQHGYYQETP